MSRAYIPVHFETLWCPNHKVAIDSPSISRPFGCAAVAEPHLVARRPPSYQYVIFPGGTEAWCRIGPRFRGNLRLWNTTHDLFPGAAPAHGIPRSLGPILEVVSQGADLYEDMITFLEEYYA